MIAAFAAQFVAPALHPAVAKAMGDRAKDAQRPLSLFDAARLGVFVHGLAGEMWASRTGCEAGMLPEDLVQLIPAAVACVKE